MVGQSKAELDKRNFNNIQKSEAYFKGVPEG
jgi:hypothetical protein